GALIGLCGVPVFLFLSGFLFKERKNAKEFWLIGGVLDRIIIPWIIWGVITYLIGIKFKTGNFSALDMINWIIGYNTWLYYVPVLLGCYFVCRIAKNNIYANIVLLILSFVSWTLTKNGIIIGDRMGLYVTNYMNFFNFLWMFITGRLCKIFIVNPVKIFSGNTTVTVLCAFAAISLGIVYIGLLGKGAWIAYWGSYISLPFMAVSGWFILQLAWRTGKLRIFREIGKQSYIIYFIHMPIVAGALNKLLFNRLGNYNEIWDFGILFIKPALIVAVSVLMVSVMKTGLKLLRLDRVDKCLGIIADKD
ncbi:MAG: acyltransferase, partial [Clostridia bacterium]|nr:acyltransferase [Clostridia bacterium]